MEKFYTIKINDPFNNNDVELFQLGLTEEMLLKIKSMKIDDPKLDFIKIRMGNNILEYIHTGKIAPQVINRIPLT